MQDITIKGVDQVPDSEFSPKFIQHMVNAMSVSFYKYGSIPDAKGKIDLIACLKKRLEKYEATGNTEWLVDIANFAMIEFMIPNHPHAHFEGTDSNKSPGRKFNDDGRWDKRRKNTDL